MPVNYHQCLSIQYKHGIAPKLPFNVEDIEVWLAIKNFPERVLCPSSPYMCHNDRCGCRQNIKYRNVIR
jgi:hypothetical protein